MLDVRNARAEVAMFDFSVHFVPCDDITKVDCWYVFGTQTRLGRMPGAGDWVFFGGDGAFQPAGRTDTFAVAAVMWVPGLFGSVFSSTFNQRGDLNVGIVSVEDGRFTVESGTGKYAQLKVGHDPLQGRRSDGVARLGVFEQLGGTVQASGEVRLGDNSFSLDSRNSGELHLRKGTFSAPAGVRGVGESVTRVTSALYLDGGAITTPTIQGLTDLFVGSGATPSGYLDLTAGRTVSAGRVVVGRDGALGTVQVSGAGATLTGQSLVLGSGALGRGGLGVGFNSPGNVQVGSLTMGVGAGSTGGLQIEGDGGDKTVVTVTGAMDVGFGGGASVILRSGGRLTAGSVRMGLGEADAPIATASVKDAGSVWTAGQMTVGALSRAELTVLQGGRIAVDELTVGSLGRLSLSRGMVNAGTAVFGEGSTLTVNIFGATAGIDYSQMLQLKQLDFWGALELKFADGYAPQQGQRFQLFGFQNFSGNLSPDVISVTGFDKAGLDFSQLAIDGSFGVGIGVIPEPTGWAFWSVGLGVFAGFRWFVRGRVGPN